MPIININNLTFGYDGSEKMLFENVTITLDTTWKLALAGRNAEIVKEVIMRHGYVKTADITRHDYNGICSEIEDMAKAGD